MPDTSWSFRTASVKSHRLVRSPVTGIGPSVASCGPSKEGSMTRALDTRQTKPERELRDSRYGLQGSGADTRVHTVPTAQREHVNRKEFGCLQSPWPSRGPSPRAGRRSVTRVATQSASVPTRWACSALHGAPATGGVFHREPRSHLQRSHPSGLPAWMF